MARRSGNPDFDLFKLPDEHDELRAVLRDLCEKEIAPLRRRSRRAFALPGRGAQGADRRGLRGGARARGVRRPGRRRGRHLHRHRGGRAGVRSSSLIPAVNKLGTMGLIMRGSEELKKQVLPPLAAGEAMAPTRCPSARPAATRRRCAPGRVQDGDDWVLNGTKCWITNGGRVDVVHRDGGDRSRQAAPTASRRSWCTRTTRASSSAPRNASWASRARRPREMYFENCRIPGDRIIGEPGTGFKTALATLDHTRPTIGAQARRHRPGRAGRGDRIHQGAQAVRQVDRRLPGRCSSCSPTWR